VPLKILFKGNLTLAKINDSTVDVRFGLLPSKDIG